MPSGSSAIVQKLWNYCTVLRDDGLSYPDVIAAEIAEDLQAALDQFAQIATDLKT